MSKLLIGQKLRNFNGDCLPSYDRERTESCNTVAILSIDECSCFTIIEKVKNEPLLLYIIMQTVLLKLEVIDYWT